VGVEGGQLAHLADDGRVGAQFINGHRGFLQEWVKAFVCRQIFMKCGLGQTLSDPFGHGCCPRPAQGSH
jgi:hypothetical protein